MLTDLNLGVAVGVQVEEQQTPLQAVVALDREVAMQLEDKCALLTTRPVHHRLHNNAYNYVSSNSNNFIQISPLYCSKLDSHGVRSH